MTRPINEHTPKQIGDVVGVDRMDSIDRAKLDPLIKLQLLSAETKSTTGRDPRGGGFAFVCRPRVMLQLLIDCKAGPFTSGIRLNKAVVLGSKDGDVVGWWEDIPLIVRCNVVDDNLHCVPRDKIPDSKMIDRRRAGELRLHAHNNVLDRLKGP